MFIVQAPILVVPTADAKRAVGVHLHAAGLAAYRDALAAKGLEIAHLSSSSVVAGVSPRR